jgi:gliding motility-associated-like protein
LKKIFTILYIFLGFRLSAQLSSNKGTDFWTGYSGHIDGTSSNMSLYLTSDVSTSGVVSIPGKNWTTNFNVTANTVTVVSIPQSLAYMNCSDCILNQGIHVTSVKDIVVFAHIYSNSRSDATLVLPTATAGRDYYTMNYNQSQTGNGRENEFIIVGFEDSTIVDITPINSLLSNSHAAGVTYSKTLMAGEVYQAQSDYDLTGTKISSSTNSGTSCKRIAVFSGSSWTALGCAGAGSGDNLYQQLYPISAWGKTFITAPWKTRTGGDIFRVLASLDNTTVTINGWNTQTINAGTFYEWQNDSALYITADKPIMLAEYQRTQGCDNVTGDPSMVILNPVEQKLDDITLYSSPYQNITGHYINILTESDDTSNIYLDGSKVTWKTVPKNTAYAYSQSTVSSGTHHVYGDSGFNAIAYGFGNFESYGYSGGANLVNLVQSIGLKYKTATATCKNQPVYFVGNCIYTPLKWKWTFGDGGTDSVQNPSHVYADTGTYTATLVTLKSNGNDCNSQDSTIYTVTIYHIPEPEFTYSTGCSNAPVIFTDSSKIASGSILTYYWKFGDGNTSSAKSPSHQYATSGTYQVIHTSTGAGNCAYADTQAIVINQSPVVKYITKKICFPDSIALLDSSTLGGVMKTNYACYQTIVDWGDTSKKDTIYNQIGGHTFKHVYKYANTYTVKMLGIDCYTGCKDSFSKTIPIYSKPVPKCSYINTCQKDTAYITDSSSMAYGSITSWKYYFGDGSSTTYASKPATIKHIYTNSGTYTISVVAINANGCSDSVATSITIYPKPVPLYSATSVCVPESALYINSSAISSGSITQALLNLGDGNQKTLTSDSTYYYYSSTGTYTSKLILTSNYGCKDSTTKSITVSPKPNADFSISNGCQLDSIKITDNSTVASGSISSRYWDFGNGDTGTYTASSIKKIYTDTGTYTLQLIITTNRSCKDTQNMQVTIYPKPTGLIFSNNACRNDSAISLDSSVVGYGNITQSRWYWGNGDSSIITNQQSIEKKKYIVAGNYLVKLISISNHNCKDTSTDSVTIYQLPQAGFTTSNYCINDSITLTDLSTNADGQIIIRNWYLGDGNSYTRNDSLPVKHQYTAVGTKVLSLVTTTNYGCKDSIAKSINIDTIPHSAFTFQNKCTYDSGYFYNKSSIYAGSISQYIWDWGDSTTQAKSDTTGLGHLYKYGGYHAVKLISISAKSCKDTATQNVYIWPQPETKAILPNICFKDSVFFVDQTTNDSGTTNLWNWDFGDGGTSTNNSPSHKYPGIGNYLVSLITRNTWGCYDTLQKIFTVNSNPIAKIYWDIACEKDSVQLYDSTFMAFGTVYLWHWDLGDGDTSNIQHPKHLYSDTGIYNLKLYVASGNLCKDSITSTVHVRPNPVSSFTNSPVCPDDSGIFNPSASHIDYGIIPQYNWWWGDGDSASSYNNSAIKHIYNQSGSYHTLMQAVSNYQCTDTIGKWVTIYPKPVNQFYFQNKCIYDSVNFIDSSSILYGSINNWKWSFGDGNTKNQSAGNVSHLYAAEGTYTAELISTSNYGCKDTLSKSVVVHPKPKAVFVIQNACFGDSIVVIDSSTLAYGQITTWDWRRGDTSASFQQLTSSGFSYIYSAYGNYTISLIIQSDSGCIDSMQHNAQVYPLPKPNFIIQNTCLRDSFIITDSTSIPFGTITQWQWDWGDGSTHTVLYNTTIPKHIFPTDGLYNIQLIATSGLSCIDSISKSITIYPHPVAYFNMKDVCELDSVIFTDQSTISSTSLDTWAWQFGDGKSASFSNGNQFKHLYSTPSNYISRLIVSSIYYCNDTAYDTVIVHPLPKVSFTAKGNCQKDSAEFIDQSTILFDTLAAVSWNFGNGRKLYQSPIISPTYFHYTDFGSFDVTEKLYSSFGCSDSFIKTISVAPSPNSWFVAPPVCFNDTTVFTQQSTIAVGNITTWEWNLDDGNSFIFNLDSPGFEHIYLAPKDYIVTLKTTSDSGCINTYTQTVIVHPLPQPHIIIKPTEGCVPLTVTLTDSSTIARDSIVSRHWYLGDGYADVDSLKLINTYTKPGNYSPALALTTDAGCKDSIYLTDAIIVHELPVASYMANPDSVSFFMPFVGFTNTSQGAISYRWNFGDGNILDSNINTRHIYADTGAYHTRLIAANIYGCVDTAFHRVFIAPDHTFYIPNSFSPNDDGVNDVFMPEGIYKGVISYEISIYNRWGEQIFHALEPTPPVPSNMKSAWDGTYRGQAAEMDVYVYRIDLIDYFKGKHNYTGFIHLIR